MLCHIFEGLYISFGVLKRFCKSKTAKFHAHVMLYHMGVIAKMSRLSQPAKNQGFILSRGCQGKVDPGFPYKANSNRTPCCNWMVIVGKDAFH